MAWFKIDKSKQTKLNRKEPVNIFKKEPEYKQDYKQAQKQAQNKSRSGNKKLVWAAVVIIVIVALYYFYVLGVNQTVVNAPAVVNITHSGTIFNVNSQQYLISLSSISISTGKAYIHVSRLPIFLNSLLNVTLTLNNITKINAGSTYANVGVQLQSLSANSITVKVSPLFASLQIAPDSQDIRVIQSSLYNFGQAPGATTSIVATTTVTGSSTTSATTAGTTTPTTTISNVNQTALNINIALKKSALYGLLLNFSVLYANTSRCTSTIYNSTYIYIHGHAPNGQNSFVNVSPNVPYNLSSTTVAVSGSLYNVVFKTKTVSSFFNNVVAVTLGVNASSKTVINQTFAGAGVFSGLNYTVLSKNYAHALLAGGACGVEV